MFWRRGGGVERFGRRGGGGGGYAGVAVAAWRGVLKYPAADAVPDLFFSMRRRPALIWTLVQHDVGLIDGLRSRRESALLPQRAQGQRSSSR